MINNRIVVPESAYIHENELNQFIHIQVPMELVVSDCFSNISGDAKILYGLLLNRTGLSIRNGWKDDNERTYIYYTIEDVMADLHVSHSKASRLFSELSNILEIGKDDNGNSVWFGLIEKVRVLNKPSRIYVHKVTEIKEILDSMSEDTNTTDEVKNEHNKAPETTDLQVVSNIGRRTSQKWDDGHLKNETTDISEIGRRTSQIWDENNNYNINNNKNYIEENNNHSYLSSCDSDSEKAVMNDDVMERLSLTREMIKDNIEYDTLISYKYISKEQVDELIEIMVEVCVLREEVYIHDIRVPHALIQSRFEKYDMFTMQYVLDSLANNTTKVKNIKKYLLAVLYNAPMTMDNQVRLQVQHDMSSDSWHNSDSS